ncbi:YwqG family protein [Kribbella sp. NBC_01245]|uniref:YwqG family protein n=1 Tax=Kribbella sp. NBC_01245 TaxID=2903578 RepID=UPI002E2A8912|nr:YwqG family protein [Kribbella sp. NBC_01245]
MRLLVEQVADHRLGASRLGGRPDLPAKTAWPDWDGVPLAFIAQIDLADTHSFDAEGALPARGLLSFFYETETAVWGSDPKDRGGWAVLFTPPGAQLVRREPPSGLSVGGRFEALRLRPVPTFTFVPCESAEFEALEISPEDAFTYSGVLDRLGDEPPAVVHRLLGHPDPLQGDMQLMCQMASQGFDGYQDQSQVGLTEGARDWRLLLQVDSQPEIGMSWGDAGRLYFWMHKDQLADQEWSASWVALQCH